MIDVSDKPPLISFLKMGKLIYLESCLESPKYSL